VGALSRNGIIYIPFIYYNWFREAMPFEYDPAKSAADRRKQGIDFEEAQLLWLDTSLIEIPVLTSDEPRWLVVGKIGEKHWSAAITRRNENVRLISVRRSRREEVSIYESGEVESDRV
jgi:uncharacterized protein